MSQPFDKARMALNRSPMDDPRLMSGPFWEELRVFLAVAKSKSFNRAADILNTSQPTVSRRVHRLQDLLGCQLLISSTSGIILTDSGKRLADVLLMLDDQLSAIWQNLRAETEEAEGLVRICSTEAIAGIFIVPALGAFTSMHPKLRLHIRNPLNLNSFRNNLSDIVLGFGPSSQPGVESHPVGVVHLIPFASHDYLARNGMPTADSVSEHTFLNAEYYLSQTETWASWQNVITRGTVSHLCDNSYAYCFMVKEGLGIGLLGTYILADPALVPLDLGVHIRLPLFVQATSERLRSRPVRVVFNWLVETLGQRNPWFGADPDISKISKKVLTPALSRLLLDGLSS